MVWESEELPSQWKCFILIPLHKKKDRLECSNYTRGISLLCHSSKVFLSMILWRIRKKTEEILSEAQAGFIRGRSTIDQIFTLRQLAEKYKNLANSYMLPNSIRVQHGNMDVERNRETETESFWNGMLEEDRMSDKKRSHQKHGHLQETKLSKGHCRKDSTTSFANMSHVWTVTDIRRSHLMDTCVNREAGEGHGCWRLPRKHSRGYKAGGWRRGIEKICRRTTAACICITISQVSQLI